MLVGGEYSCGSLRKGFLRTWIGSSCIGIGLSPWRLTVRIHNNRCQYQVNIICSLYLIFELENGFYMEVFWHCFPDASCPISRHYFAKYVGSRYIVIKCPVIYYTDNSVYFPQCSLCRKQWTLQWLKWWTVCDVIRFKQLLLLNTFTQLHVGNKFSTWRDYSTAETPVPLVCEWWWLQFTIIGYRPVT
jgi:hypothetical protein